MTAAREQGRACAEPLHDPDAERALLGAVFVDDSKVDALRRAIPNLLSDRHRLIAAALLHVARNGKPLDVVTVKTDLERRGKLDEAGGPAMLADLLEGVPKSANAEHYADIVCELAARRELRRVAYHAGNGTGRAEIVSMLDRVRARFEDAGTVPELAAEDLADVIGRERPPTPWAVDELLAERDVGILSGPGGVGKSWVAMAMMLALASGEVLFGHYPVTRPYRVAWLDLETQPWEVDQRIGRIATGLGLIAERVRDRVKLIRQRLRFDSPDDVRRLFASLKAWRTEFLFVDSWRRTHAGSDNRSENVSGLFQTVYDPVRRDLGCGCIVTDHERKRTGERELDAADQALTGSVDKRNMADFHAGIGSHNGRVSFQPTKTRHHGEVEPILLDLAGLDDEDEDDGPVSVLYHKDLDPASDACQDAIWALLPEDGRRLWRGEIIGRSGYSEKSVGNALAAMVKRGRITKHKEPRPGKRVFYGRKTAVDGNDGKRRQANDA